MKDLQAVKRISSEEQQHIDDILKQNEITTELLIQKLSLIGSLSEDVVSLKRNLEESYNKYKFVLEREQAAKTCEFEAKLQASAC